MQLTSSIRWYKEGSQLVILNLETGRLFNLNESALLVWEAFVRASTQEECVSSLTKTYSLTREQAEADVAAFLAQLSALGILD